MYKLLKEKGYDVSVSVVNTDTDASLVIGRLSITMLRILEEYEGLKFGDEEDALKFTSVWDFAIKEETKDALARLTLKMSKPVRNQSVKTEQVVEAKENKQVDAMDVLLGLANYN